MKAIGLSSIRRQNLRKLLELLTLSPARTRQELADASGLSPMTVTNLVDLLKEQQMLNLTPIHCRRESHPSSGRKADAIKLSGESKAWLIVDISNLQPRLTLLGFDMQPLLEMRDAQQGEYGARLAAFLRSARPQVDAALGQRELLGVAIVTPGPYEIEKDTVTNQRIPQLNHVKIKALFQRYFGEQEYYVDEDVKFAVRACYAPYAEEQCELLYYLYIGEGVGGAAIHGGNMLRGLNATAGDAGHIRDASGQPYESRLNLDAFAAQLQKEMPGGVSPSAAAEMCPEAYQAALDQMARYTAEMLHGVLWMLDPTHIIIDCSYAVPFEEFYLRRLREHLLQLFSGEERTLPLLRCADRQVSSVLRGAVTVLRREWLERIIP